MAAYFISHGTITDQARMAEYVERSGPVFADHGGEFVTAGAVRRILTGSHDHHHTAIFRFPDVTSAETCCESDAYKALTDLRTQAGDFDFFVIEEYQ